MKIALNITLHIVAGLGCFTLFWLASYNAYERDAWAQLVAVGLGCAITAFAISFLGRRMICPGCPKSIAATAFSIGFIFVTLISMLSLFDGGGQWKVSAFWLPIAMAVFTLSYWGSAVGSRVPTPRSR